MGSLFVDALDTTRLYPLTDRHLSGLSHAEQLSQLNKGGVNVVQLREKSLSPIEFYDEVAMALQVARPLGVTVIVNDRVDIVLALKADGVHLGQDDLPPEAARRLLGHDALIGLSTHNLDQAQRAARLPINYVAIGPIFATSTKQSSNPPLGLAGLREVREAIGEIPLVAIGGITSQNSQDVLNAGADAISVISDLWAETDQVIAKTTTLLHRV